MKVESPVSDTGVSSDNGLFQKESQVATKRQTYETTSVFLDLWWTTSIHQLKILILFKANNGPSLAFNMHMFYTHCEKSKVICKTMVQLTRI